MSLTLLLFLIYWGTAWPVSYWFLEKRCEVEYKAADDPLAFLWVIVAASVIALVFWPCCAWYWFWRIFYPKNTYK